MDTKSLQLRAPQVCANTFQVCASAAARDTSATLPAMHNKGPCWFARRSASSRGPSLHARDAGAARGRRTSTTRWQCGQRARHTSAGPVGQVAPSDPNISLAHTAKGNAGTLGLIAARHANDTTSSLSLQRAAFAMQAAKINCACRSGGPRRCESWHDPKGRHASRHTGEDFLRGTCRESSLPSSWG